MTHHKTPGKALMIPSFITKRSTNTTTTTALRALKRKESLGLGATIVTEGGNSESTGSFSAVLKQLQETHGGSNIGSDKGSKSGRSSSRSSKKKKSKSKTNKADDNETTTPTSSTTIPALTLAQNRCNAGRRKIRDSKFAHMSPADMAAVFGNKDFITNSNSNTSMEPAAVAVPKDDEPQTSCATPPTTTTTTTIPLVANNEKSSKDSRDKKRKSKSEYKKSQKDKKKRRTTSKNNDACS